MKCFFLSHRAFILFNAFLQGKEAANGRTKKAMVVSDSDSDFWLEEDDIDYEEAIPKKGSKKPAVEHCLVYGCRGTFHISCGTLLSVWL